MSSCPPPDPGASWRIEDALERIEMELRQAITFFNDAMVPEIRRESISAMRTAAETLRSLADRMEQSAGGPKEPRA